LKIYFYLSEIKNTILLPSRIILYNSSSLSQVATQIFLIGGTPIIYSNTAGEIFKEEDIFPALMKFFQQRLTSKK